ncbi:MAG: XRE family transcriptional regulator [Mesorhizobium sp.]|uniref:helix-turn-helix domain-containing protein n=1 Tax=Mesorhizobium sp. TaxID=1871066 RepID=UPI000FE7BADA|nr:helix-turn-helix transcriptional regulator [Mesorhizobium sp.]RWF41603.1 MAG: XRE family transcriptional regulator [Mesorhizobium sp.]
MTPEEFKAWRLASGFSQTEAAEALGISRGSVENYERGSRREDARPVEIPGSIDAIIHVYELLAREQSQLDFLNSLGGEGIRERTIEHPEWRDITLETVKRQEDRIENLVTLLASLTNKKPA